MISEIKQKEAECAPSKTYVCIKCGKRFSKMAGGVVMGPKDMELELRPVCDRCKFNTITSIFTGKR